MNTLIPALFAVLAALALLSLVFTAWQSLRALLDAAPLGDALSDGASATRAALLLHKDALLEDLRDLRFDHDLGKLSDADFEQVDEKLRAEATAALKALDDDIAPFRAAAEALIAERLGRTPAGRSSAPPADRRSTPTPDPGPASLRVCPACTVGNDPDSVFCKKCGGRLTPISCTSCGTVNDADATFCKKCGASLAEAAAATVPSEPAS